MYSCLAPQPLANDASADLQRRVAAAARARGGRWSVTLATDAAENNNPRHAIRSGEHGWVGFATLPILADITPLGMDGIGERRLLPTRGSRLR